jgi:hypothetical protein
MLTRTIALFALLAASLQAEQVDPVDAAVAKLAAASKASDLVLAKAALDEAKALATRLEFPEPRATLAEAVGACIRQNARRSPGVTLLALDALGEMGVDGSTKLLGSLLRPPAKMQPGFDRVYLDAIRVVGELHEPVGVRPLLKLLRHKNTDVAVAAANALAGYAAEPAAERLALLGKLNRELGSFERKYRRSKQFDQRDAANRVKTHLRAAMSRIAKESAATTSAEWSKWLREAVRDERRNSP